MNLLVYGTYFVLLGLIVLWDLRSGKIPNVLLVLLLFTNFFFVETLFDGSGDFKQVFGGMLVRIVYALLMVVFLFPFFSVGALGAGDVKLIAVSALGVSRPLLFFLIVFVIAAVLGILKLVINKNAVGRIKGLTNYIRSVVLTGGISPYLSTDEVSEKITFCIHLSVPVFAALVLMFLLEFC